MPEQVAINHRPRHLLWVVGMIVASALAFLGGLAVGNVVEDPMATDAYREVAAARNQSNDQNRSLRADRDRLSSELDNLKSSSEKRESELAQKEAELSEREEALSASEASLGEREQAVTAAEEERAANTFSDGTWTVGVDISPGTYRSDEPVADRCYWGIYRTGSNGSDIIENDIPGGGRPSVTLREGQDFTSRRCGAWSRQ